MKHFKKYICIDSRCKSYLKFYENNKEEVVNSHRKLCYKNKVINKKCQ